MLETVSDTTDADESRDGDHRGMMGDEVDVS